MTSVDPSSAARAESARYDATTRKSAGQRVASLALWAPVAALVPALGLGVAGLFGRGPRWMRARPVAAALVTGASAALLARWQLARLFTEQPDYEVERTIGDLEIRRYQPRVVAETTVDAADWDQALDEGFRRLARYIFGGNSAKQRIAMTAPVSASPKRGEAERIAMTSPVTSSASAGAYLVTFTMPKGRTPEDLPEPNDRRVRVYGAPSVRVAALRYRGRYDAARTRARQSELLAKVRAADLQPIGAPVFAGYDAPSTLPFLRRVEAWVPIA